VSQYSRPTSSTIHEIEIKRSRFIAQAIPLSDTAHLHRLQAQLQVEHNKASHHCLAYVLGGPEQPRAAGSSDDGEPSGTAGKPMLNVLLQQKIGDVGVVVTRYFGGTKLGAGGLIRAYAQAVAELVKVMPLEQVESRKELSLNYPYNLEPQIQRVLNPLQVDLVEERFGESVSKTLSVVESDFEALRASLEGLAHLGVAVVSLN
jgi:uncharacterized YigZ family protein